MDDQGIGPRTLCKLSTRSTTELITPDIQASLYIVCIYYLFYRNFDYRYCPKGIRPKYSGFTPTYKRYFWIPTISARNNELFYLLFFKYAHNVECYK